MNKEKRIENYFDRVKQNPPLNDIEKVQQLIAEAEVKAEVSSFAKASTDKKKGRRNILKFTVMTTLFAIIICAVLFWTRAEEQIPNPKNQKPNISIQTVKSVSLENKEVINIEANDIVPFTVENNDNKQISSDQKIEGFSFSQTQIEPEAIECDIDYPIDGVQFIVKADKTLLEKLGFTFKGAGIYYQNDTPESGLVTRHIYNSPERSFYNSMHHPYISDSTILSNHDFYLQMVTYVSGQIIDQRPGYHSYEMANDTLLPILIPMGLINDKEHNDVILWFRVTKSLLKNIYGLSDDLKEELNNAIRFKRNHPDINLISYQSKPILTKTEFIEIGVEELKQLGLFFDKDIHFKLRYRKSKSTIGERFISGDINQYIENIYHDSVNYFYMPVVTDTFGLILNIEGKFNFNQLVPVLVKREIWGRKNARFITTLILWFEPTLSFFDALPKEIGDELKLEYNYINAEDKSTLEKPKCKYFDECKNTLKINDFKVFPNPANNNATVSFSLPEPMEGRITLVDLTGRERQVLQAQSHFSSGFHRFDLDVSDVPEGIYLITLYSDKGIQTKRFIVTR